LDHDIHAYQVANSLQTTLELAKKNNHDNYGDIIKNQHQIHFVDCADAGELEAEFRRIVLFRGSISKTSLPFGNPMPRTIGPNPHPSPASDCLLLG